MSEFRFAYEKQDAEYVKRKIEIGVPILFPTDIVDEVNAVKHLTEKDDDNGKSNKKPQLPGESIQPASVAMIAIAVALAAITGNK